jgi:hypothetical protein
MNEINAIAANAIAANAIAANEIAANAIATDVIAHNPTATRLVVVDVDYAEDSPFYDFLSRLERASNGNHRIVADLFDHGTFYIPCGEKEATGLFALLPLMLMDRDTNYDADFYRLTFKVYNTATQKEIVIHD